MSVRIQKTLSSQYTGGTFDQVDLKSLPCFKLQCTLSNNQWQALQKSDLHNWDIWFRNQCFCSSRRWYRIIKIIICAILSTVHNELFLVAHQINQEKKVLYPLHQKRQVPDFWSFSIVFSSTVFFFDLLIEFCRFTWDLHFPKTVEVFSAK